MSFYDIASPASYDWVGIYRPGAADNAYLKFAYTGGAANGMPRNVPIVLPPAIIPRTTPSVVCTRASCDTSGRVGAS